MVLTENLHVLKMKGFKKLKSSIEAWEALQYGDPGAHWDCIIEDLQALVDEATEKPER